MSAAIVGIRWDLGYCRGGWRLETGMAGAGRACLDVSAQWLSIDSLERMWSAGSRVWGHTMRPPFDLFCLKRTKWG